MIVVLSTLHESFDHLWKAGLLIRAFIQALAFVVCSPASRELVGGADHVRYGERLRESFV